MRKIVRAKALRARTWSRRKKDRLQRHALRFALFSHCSLRDGLLRYTTKVAMESPIIVCSHQNDLRIDNVADTLLRGE